MYNNHQRETYKLVEDLASGSFDTEIDFLKSLIIDIVDHEKFQINGGRIWKLIEDEDAYSLHFQYGNVTEIPEGYKLDIDNQPILNDLTERRTNLNKENDPVLIEKGISIYSVTGVGDIIKSKKGKYYRYVLGFNATEILQSFYETLNIISSVATIKIRDISQYNMQEKLRRDLAKASEIQKNIFPEHYIEFHDYKIYGVCIPDSEVGGDYFDYLRNMDDEEERLGILIGDAASKGLSAAIQALFITGAVRMASFFSPKISSLVSRLNTLVYENFPYERFATLFYCELSLSSNRLVLYANAGHCEPIQYVPEKDRFETLKATGGLLGILKQQKFKVESVIMRPGDILVLFTDGINEAQSKDGEIYGDSRVKSIIKKNKDKSPKDIALAILDDILKFSANSEYTDDKTLIVVKRDSN